MGGIGNSRYISRKHTILLQHNIFFIPSFKTPCSSFPTVFVIKHKFLSMESKPQNLSRVLWSPGNTSSLYRSLAPPVDSLGRHLPGPLPWDFLLVYFHVDQLPLISVAQSWCLFFWMPASWHLTQFGLNFVSPFPVFERFFLPHGAVLKEW